MKLESNASFFSKMTFHAQIWYVTKNTAPFKRLYTLYFKCFRFYGILKKLKKRVSTVVRRDSLRVYLSLNANHANCAVS
jgi:hypothetical protein